MFLTEVVAGLMAGSVSLQADALDFLGDALNYGISLAVVGMALSWRARCALQGCDDGRLRPLGDWHNRLAGSPPPDPR
jgi:hypothetical protein